MNTTDPMYHRHYMMITHSHPYDDEVLLIFYIGYRDETDSIYSAEIDTSIPPFTSEEGARKVVAALNHQLTILYQR